MSIHKKATASLLLWGIVLFSAIIALSLTSSGQASNIAAPDKGFSQVGSPILLPQPQIPTGKAPEDQPPYPSADIPWSAGTSNVADIQTAFNNARTTENTQLGSNLPMMTMPDQGTWDAMSDSDKALWLINSERTARGLLPFHGAESNVQSVAQSYAQYLLDNNTWGHDADGRDPWQRMDANPTINACREFLPIGENLAVFVTSSNSIALPVERSVYDWMYDDGTCCGWGHRDAMMYYPFNDNGGPAGQEGFMGIGRASGGPYQGPFSESWNFAELIVYNVFDPCASWEYGSATSTPTPTATATQGPPPAVEPVAWLPLVVKEGTLSSQPTPTPTATQQGDPTATPTPTPTPTQDQGPGIISSLLLPFDANQSDLTGPSGWGSNYGKRPEIIAASNGTEIDVLAQDYDAGTAWDAVLLHIAPDAGGYTITQALTGMPMLDRIMGLAIDDAGNRYYATGVDEGAAVNPTYPPTDTYRSDIVRVIKLDLAGGIQFNIDLDIARHDFDPSAEMIINPMVAASSRLSVGGNEIALVHGINTDPDWSIEGTRHQKALSTRLDAASGAVTRVASVWVSHSFDQRLLFDGTGNIEFHLGDAFPRYLVFNRNHLPYPLFRIKGDLGENNTTTRLGNIALIENDLDYGYLALFATESNATTGNIINGPRNLAIVRVNKNDNSIDPNLPDTLTVISSGTEYTNRIKWLTTYSADSNLHAERPKLIGIGGNEYIVLWEEWLSVNGNDTFNGVFGMVIDDQGNTIQTAKLITNQHHLQRGDDAFFLDNRAAWITGNASEKKLYIHFVDALLNYEMVILD